MHGPVPIPASVASRHPGWDARLAYHGGPQSAVWELTSGVERRFLKVAQLGWEYGLTRERVRMEWARSRLPVPHVLGYGEADGVEWLLTAALQGVPGTDSRLRQDPATLVRVLARGLRALHDTAAGDCPFTWRLSDALACARARVASDMVQPALHFHPEHAHLTPHDAGARLEALRPDDEDLVLCHGDYCPPNALIHEGAVRGYVDLGALAIADRWWDLAVATWSLGWNFGPGWEPAFLEEYGIEPDPVRTSFYRLLYDLTA
jgi:kanamycin kinase